jgi:hypothetical protein
MRKVPLAEAAVRKVEIGGCVPERFDRPALARLSAVLMSNDASILYADTQEGADAQQSTARSGETRCAGSRFFIPSRVRRSPH